MRDRRRPSGCWWRASPTSWSGLLSWSNGAVEEAESDAEDDALEVTVVSVVSPRPGFHGAALLASRGSTQSDAATLSGPASAGS